MQHFDQKRQIMIRHLPPNSVLHQIHPNHARQVLVAHVLTPRIRRPHPRRRRHLPEQPEFAIEKKFRETGSRRRGPVVVGEAEGVGVAVRATGEVCGFVLTGYSYVIQ